MSNTAIQEIELNIVRAKEIVAKGDALERLMKNQDFKAVVQRGYFEAEAIRLVHLKSDPQFQTPDRQQSIVSQMDAIGALNQYFEVVFRQADMARKAIASDEETRDELLAEEAGR